jgi:hypothetical protein
MYKLNKSRKQTRLIPEQQTGKPGMAGLGKTVK